MMRLFSYIEYTNSAHKHVLKKYTVYFYVMRMM